MASFTSTLTLFTFNGYNPKTGKIKFTSRHVKYNTKDIAQIKSIRDELKTQIDLNNQFIHNLMREDEDGKKVPILLDEASKELIAFMKFKLKKLNELLESETQYQAQSLPQTSLHNSLYGFSNPSNYAPPPQFPTNVNRANFGSISLGAIPQHILLSSQPSLQPPPQPPTTGSGINPWITHVKKVQKQKGISYKEAMKIAKHTYK